ncbi:hypothetical protein DFR65_1076 [Oceanihabitans sediminis]|uniref:Uncharacterized protein n=1 Tax=Oceanihabitans sediminis TaxID=1812012 RepID=A0A368P230_9FLAO|nr:hypothetical protein [Oceanihabitans sediminis]RBP28390.1 hypothetical protein DFR65_1076 [Oceanihabitans sediminis]RCU56588.1 hypothetical protein DU428_11895 [Oceanihabitans sediminis]
MYEPDLEWYNNNLIFQHGEFALLMDNYQGNITKLTLERELIWSTKNNTSSRSNTEAECTISVYQYCSCNTPTHTYDNLGNCSCVDTIQIRNCPSGGGGGGGGGGSSNNNEDDCQTSGTIILDGQPIAGIGGDCAPNVEVAVNPSVDDEKECKKIENLFLNNRTIKTKIQTLATKVTDNIEHSHSFHEGGSEYQKTSVFGSGGIDYPEYASKYKSLAHTHDSYGEDGSGTQSVFSMADLQVFAKLAYFNKLDSGTFVAFFSY